MPKAAPHLPQGASIIAALWAPLRRLKNRFATGFRRFAMAPAARSNIAFKPEHGATRARGSGSLFDFLPLLGENAIGLEQPMKQSAYVSAAVKMISKEIAAAQMYFQVGSQPLKTPELDALWARPAGLSLPDFIEASVGWLKLKGEVFYLLDDRALVPFPSVALSEAIAIPNPARMNAILERGAVVGWQLLKEGNTRIALLPEQVVQVKCWNPYDPVRGLADYEPARIASESDYAAGRFVRDLSASNGDTGPVISAPGGITEEQSQQIIQQLRMKREMQRRGEFRPVFLSAEIRVEDVRQMLPGPDFASLRRMSQAEIFLAFGVPPSFASPSPAYAVSSSSEYGMFVSGTCAAIGKSICGGIAEVTRRLLRDVPRNIEARLDWDEHPVMQAVRRERLASVDSLWSKGASMQQINAYLDLGMQPFKGWQVGYLPFGVQPRPTGAASAASKSRRHH